VPEELSALATTLHAARHFEQAALVTLRALLQVAQQTLQANRFAGRGRLLRGVVHLRPADAYRRLAALEWEAVESQPSGQESLLLADSPQVSLLASASAWRAVVEHGCAVSIDVGLGTLQPHQGPARSIPSPSLAAAFTGEPAAVVESGGHARLRSSAPRAWRAH
jgi:hypothetical protein